MLFFGSRMMMLNIIKRISLLLQYHYPRFYAIIAMHEKEYEKEVNI